MKNSNNVSNSVNLILNIYKCLFFKLLLRTSMLLDKFDRDALAGQRGNGKILESATFEICKFIIAKMINV